MSAINFYSDLKIIPNYDEIFDEISNKVPEFRKIESWLYNDEETLSELYKIRWMQKETFIDLDILFSSTYFNEIFLNRDESRFYKKHQFSFMEWKETLIHNLYKLLRINNYIQSEIGKYILNDSRIWLRRLEYRFHDKFIQGLIEKIDWTDLFKRSIRDWFDVGYRSLIDSVNEVLLEKEFLEIEAYIDWKSINIWNQDFGLTFIFPIDIILKFIISKFEEKNIQIDTKKIESLFEVLSIGSRREAHLWLRISLLCFLLIFIFNIFLIFFNNEFNIVDITKYIPILLLEIILFKFMFFFFDKYNTYSKISSIYDYYVWLVQSDNIYTSDKKFTTEQNFLLREKTYLELTNLSSHIKWIIDKKWNSWNDILQTLKEFNNISPLLKNLK